MQNLCKARKNKEDAIMDKVIADAKIDIQSAMIEREKDAVKSESKQRATAIANRNKDKENLEIIVGNLNDVTLNEKFDYITLIGVLEYAPLYTNSENPFEDFLGYINMLLRYHIYYHLSFYV